MHLSAHFSLYVSLLIYSLLAVTNAKVIANVERPARKFWRPIDGHLTVEIMLADVLSQNVRCFIAAYPRSKRFVKISVAVAETVADCTQYAAGVGVVFEVDIRTAADGQLLMAAADDTEVKIWWYAGA